MRREHAAQIEAQTRLRLLEHAASELLESERNGSLLVGVSGAGCAPLVVTAIGCSVHVALGSRSAVLIDIASLRRDTGHGPRALAEGCDRTLRSVHHLGPDFVPTLRFGDPVNAARFLLCCG